MKFSLVAAALSIAAGVNAVPAAAAVANAIVLQTYTKYSSSTCSAPKDHVVIRYPQDANLCFPIGGVKGYKFTIKGTVPSSCRMNAYFNTNQNCDMSTTYISNPINPFQNECLGTDPGETYSSYSLVC